MLEERKTDVYVECFRFEGSKTICRGSLLLAAGLQVVQRLLQAEVFEIVAECFQGEKSGELLVPAQHGVFADIPICSGRGRDISCLIPPARILTSGITAWGSYLG